MTETERLNGVAAYSLPEGFCRDIDGVTLRRITEDPASYEGDPCADSVNCLIARQGAVNRMLKTYRNVRWLQLLNAGFEKVDLGLLRERGIVFTNARSVYCSTIAEDVLAKMLILARNYMIHFRQQQEHFWPDDEQLANGNIDLNGRVLGILGAGAIGREIAVRARVFGMTVLGFDPFVRAQTGFDGIESRDLNGFLARCDFVITSLPVTESTKNIIGADALSHMKPTAFLINVARGQIVDEAALADALNRGVIRGAAIDVTKEEPLLPDDPLWTADNILITPHRAAYGDQMHDRMCGLIAENIRRRMSGEELKDRVRI